MEAATRKRIVMDIMALNNLSLIKLVQQTSPIVPDAHSMSRADIIDAFIVAKYGTDGQEWVEESLNAILPPK